MADANGDKDEDRGHAARNQTITALERVSHLLLAPLVAGRSAGARTCRTIATPLSRCQHMPPGMET